MLDRPPRYRSYLLTVWEERSSNPNAPPAWRFSLEDARTGQRRGYAGLEALVTALEQELADYRVEERAPAARPAHQASRPAGHGRGETGSGRRSERR